MAGDFTDLVVWKEAVALAGDVARLARALRGAASWSAAEQLVRAAESIPANIAEGYGRGLGKDFLRFLRVAAASAAELESHLTVADATGRVSSARVAPLIGRARRVRAMIRGLSQSVAARRPSPIT